MFQHAFMLSVWNQGYPAWGTIPRCCIYVCHHGMPRAAGQNPHRLTSPGQSTQAPVSIEQIDQLPSNCFVTFVHGEHICANIDNSTAFNPILFILRDCVWAPPCATECRTCWKADHWWWRLALPPLILSTADTQDCVLSSRHYSLITYNCEAQHSQTLSSVWEWHHSHRHSRLPSFHKRRREIWLCMASSNSLLSETASTKQKDVCHIQTHVLRAATIID